MAGNTWGTIFRVTTWGESHGEAIGAVIDGCPARLKLSERDIQPDLDRRHPGQSKITTGRKETDQVHILSGVFEGQTLGTPISLLIWNQDPNSQDYEYLKNTFRPSHADFTYEQKYGIRNWAGGGRASARETVARVAAGAVAKKVLQTQSKISIQAYVKQIQYIEAVVDPNKVKFSEIERNMVRCPDQQAAKKMIKLITEMKTEGDSVGGVIECVIKNVPPGLGEPVFDRLEAELAKAMLSIPATKGFEIGSGFKSVTMKGSEHNDPFIIKGGEIHTRTNNSGGGQGGISNGENIVFRIIFKPAATIFKKQKTVTKNKKEITLEMKGRHDPCVLPRAVPVVEAMAALVLVDFWLRQRIR